MMAKQMSYPASNNFLCSLFWRDMVNVLYLIKRGYRKRRIL